jgi:hypothetical protein
MNELLIFFWHILSSVGVEQQPSKLWVAGSSPAECNTQLYLYVLISYLLSLISYLLKIRDFYVTYLKEYTYALHLS